MTKRARWDGPYAIKVELPDGSFTDVIEPGQLLPLEAPSGDSIPVAIRDEMLQRSDWSEVNQADQSKSSDTKSSDKKDES